MIVERTSVIDVTNEVIVIIELRMNTNNMLSVIIPSYNEEEIIRKTASEVSRILNKADIEHELIFVDDGSKDSTWARIKELASDNPHIHGLHFSRNFGKESAIFAGLKAANGDCAVVIDCDLQHPPMKIPEMYLLWKEEGYEIVEAVKSDRGKESKMHSWAANCFYRIISKVTHIDMSNTSDFKLMDRKVITTLINMPENQTFFRALSSWVGYKTTQIPFVVAEREAGVSKWSTLSLVKYALTNITSFSSAPMQVVTLLGIIMLFVAIILGCIAIYQKISGIALGGFTTVILIILLSSSIIMISLGVIGYYISKIYEEIKGRPKYIISEQV